jgi:hypothetical protein
MATEGVKGLRQLVNNAASSSPLTTATQLPATVPAETSPVTVLLTHHQTALMDEIAAAIRRNTGAVVSRSAMVRAIAAAVLPCYPDWLACKCATDLQKQIERRLQAVKK